MASQPIASDLSYRVLQLRRERNELGACALDSTNQKLYPLPSHLVVREAYIADRPGGVSDHDWAVRRLAQRQRRLEG